MLVKLFKAATLLGLFAVLIILLSKRTFTIGVASKIESVVSPQVAHVSDTPLSPPLLLRKDSATTSPVEPLQKQVPPEPPEVLPKTPSGGYIPLETGASDMEGTGISMLSPCKEPIGFKVGTFDTRFGLSKEEFIEDITQAGGVWEQAAGKTLFDYDENGPLTVNLIYDDRQAKTEDLGYLALEIENAKQSAENLKTDYENEKTAYDLKGQIFAASSTAFKERYDVYEAKVKDYNAKGGAPKDEYDQMMLELSSLQAESKELDVMRTDLLADMDSINKKVVRYNEFVVYVNNLIKNSNALGTQKFTEGRFTPSQNKIDIYQYDDHLKLVRVLAHELGHALGMDHNGNPYSIMYALNSGTTTDLTAEDRVALSKICN